MKGCRLDLFLGTIGFLVGYLYDRSLGTAIVFAGGSMLLCAACLLTILVLFLAVYTVEGMLRDVVKTKRTLQYLFRQRDVYLNFLFGVAPVIASMMIFASSHVGESISEVRIVYFSIGLLITIVLNVVSPPKLVAPTPLR